MQKDHDRPGVLAPPPLIYGSFFTAGWLLDRSIRTPLRQPAPALRVALGLAAVSAGMALGASAVLSFRKAGTNVLPERPSLAVVTTGPYRFTRNPMYLGLALVYAGVAITVGPLTLGMLVPAALVIHIGVIRREERYLECKFGAPYVEFKRRVRRWL